VLSFIVNPLIEDYIRSLIHVDDDYIKKLLAYAHEYHVPIVQPEVADFLEIFTRSHKAESVLEIGTAIGYSASIFAKGMAGKGKVVSIELKEELHQLAKENVSQMGVDTEFDFRLGDGREVLDELDEKFDIIFIDAAKGHYQKFFDKCFNMLNKGGVIISDNVLYKGMTAHDDYVIRRKITIVKRMRTYLKFISEHPKLKTTVLPFGDGVALSYKLED